MSFGYLDGTSGSGISASDPNTRRDDNILAHANNNKHRHKHNSDNNKRTQRHADVDNDVTENDDERLIRDTDIKHEVIEPPKNLMENFTAGYPYGPPYAHWGDQDSAPW